MYLTNVLLKKAKSKYLIVMMESAVSQHTFTRLRLRSAEKLEIIKFDPLVRAQVIYREVKKIHGIE